MLAILHTFFDERDPEFVRGLYHLACGGGCLKTVALLEEAEADALSCLESFYVYVHHRCLRTKNGAGKSRLRTKASQSCG